jgi:PAS domain S-box-containing protein
MTLTTKGTEKENLFETLATKSPAGLYIVQDGKFCYTNPTFQGTTGYTEDELLGRDALELIVPEDRKQARINAIKMLKGERTSPYHFRVIHKNGSIKWIMESVVSVQYRERQATLGNFIDITEQKQAQETLQAEKNKLQSLIDALGDHITIRDRDYNLIYMAEHAKKLWGDRTGEKCYRALEDQDKVCDGCPAEKAFRDGKPHTSERQTVTPSGEVIFWETRANPIRNAEGRIVACLEIAKNVTERKQMVETLQAEKNKLQSLVDAVEYTVTIQDPEYNIIYQNEPSRIASGGDHLGEKCYRVYEGRDKVCDGCPVEKAFKDGKSNTMERRTAIAGKIAFWENTASPIRDAEGRIVACLELARDVTEHKQAEESLQAEKNKLQSLIDALEYTLSIQDKEYNIIFQNEPSRMIFGNHLGEKCYRVYEGIDKICDGCPVKKAFKDGKSHTAERQRVLPSGEVTFWEHTANPIRDAKGKIVSCLALGRNITKHKKQEQALVDEATRRHLLIDQSLDGIVVLDADARVVEANQRFAEMLGYTPEEVHKLHTWDWDKNFPPEKILEMGRNVDDKGFHLETQHTRKDGSVIDVDISINAAMFGSQKLIFCVCRDITARKQIEDTLQAERNKLQSLIDAMADGLSIQDRDYNIIFQNEPSRRSTRGDRRGEKCYRVFEGQEKVCDGCPVKKAFEDSKSHVAERQRILPSGEVTFWENTANPIRDAEGSVVACLEVGRNVSERKRAEEILNLQRAYFQQLFDTSPDAIIMMDTNDRTIQINKGFERLFGYSNEEAKGRSLIELIVPEEDAKEASKALKRIQSGEIVRKERVRRRKDGSLVDVSLLAYPIHFNGKLVGAYGIYTDITNRKQAEDALQAEKNKLQSVINAMQDDLTIQDTKYNIVFMNEPARISSGGDHVGEKCYRAYEGKESACADCPVEKSFKNGKPHISERQRILPSGELSFWETTSNPIRDASGRIVACLEIGRNITERKKQEQALADELTRRRLLVEQSLDGIVVLDENDKVYEANQRFAEMLGYTPEEVRELHTWDWEKNYSPEQIHDQGRKADEKGFLLETKHTRKDGSVIDVDISINASVFGGQKLIFCVCRDVTERKKAEHALADELARRRLLVDQSLDGIVVLGVDAKVVEANQRFAEMLGYTMEEVHRLHTWDWEKNYTHEQILEMGRGIDEKGRHLETRHTRKDGSVIDVDISISAIMYGGQKLIFCIERDITEQKKMAEALKLAAEEWRRTFDSISDAISIHDKDFRIMRANKAFADIFQMNLDQIVGKHCYELHKGKKPKTGCPHQQTLATGKPAVAEFYESHVGKYLLESTSPIFNERGEVVSTVHVTRDITEQKRQSERLMMADRLASIGELAAGTAHELNNPLTSVIGFSQLLMEKDIPDDIHEDVKFIYDEAQRAANVTKNLLTFARKHTTVKHLSQINSIIEDVLKLRAYEHKVNSIEVKKRLDPDLPEIMADYFQMQQAFLNIVINAEYFMTEAHKRGTLTITTKRRNGTVMISFADDGPGIPPENLNRIFDPFFTTKEAGKGTGLGLSICHGIVTEHGGQIYAKSQPGKGATIFVELPVNTP